MVALPLDEKLKILYDDTKSEDASSMPTQLLSMEQKSELLKLARQSLVAAASGNKAPSLNLDEQPPEFREPGACFVTLTCQGELRGCIGALEAYQPLVEDVIEHAAAAGMQDYRFPPVQPYELGDILIEISRLTQPEELTYADAIDLLRRLRPGVDGVVLQDGWRRATFLPQVWEKLPDPEDFLSHLCQKMGVASNTWRHRKLRVSIYQVEEFREA